jgi:hypothetical protein
MNYVKLAKVLVPALLGLAAVLGYGTAVETLKSAVCDPKPLTPVIQESPDAGDK